MGLKLSKITIKITKVQYIDNIFYFLSWKKTLFLNNILSVYRIILYKGYIKFSSLYYVIYMIYRNLIKNGFHTKDPELSNRNRLYYF